MGDGEAGCTQAMGLHLGELRGDFRGSFQPARDINLPLDAAPNQRFSALHALHLRNLNHTGVSGHYTLPRMLSSERSLRPKSEKRRNVLYKYGYRTDNKKLRK